MKFAFAALRVVTSGVLFFFALGVEPVAWLMWLAPLPLMLYRDDAMGRGRAFAEPLLAYLAGGMSWWPYLSTVAPAPVALLAIAQAALVFAGGMLLMWRARQRGRPLLATLMLPLTVAGCELLITTWSPHGSFGSIAYTQSDNLALMQLLSVTGLTGVTALLCWVPAALSAFWWRRERALLLAAPPVALLALVLAAGSQRIASPPTGQPMQIALLADDAQLRAYNQAGQEAAVLAAYAAHIARIGKADLIMLPEKTISIAPDRLPWLKQQLQALAARSGARLVVGINVLSSPKQNLAWLVAPGQAVRSYEKQHLVPGWESAYSHGSTPMTASGQPALAICKDLDFPGTLRAYRGAALLLVPAWDFRRDAWLHSRMAMARSIEQGIPMARSAHDGRLTLSNAHGLVLREAASSERGPVMLQASMVTGAVSTVYSRIGDSVGWVLVALWLGALVALVRPVRLGR